jgi:hypothetical protein
MERWPNFFILGAPKCGTTSLRLWLSEHPDVFVSRFKEPRFYDTDLAARWRISREAYGRLFEDVSDQHVAAGEATPWYLYSRDAVPNIEREVPAARYIVGVRNPADLAHAIFNQLRLNKTESIPDFGEAWAASPLRRRGGGARRLVAEPRLLDYQSVCALGEQLGRLYALVPRERVLVVVLDDLAEDPGREYRRVLEFLGAPDDHRDALPTANASFRIRYRPAQRVISLGMKSERVLKAKLGRPPVTSPFMQSLNARNRIAAPREALDPALRRAIEEHFADDVAELGKLLDRDLSAWATAG